MGLERVVAVLGDKWTTAGNNMTPDVCRIEITSDNYVVLDLTSTN